MYCSADCSVGEGGILFAFALVAGVTHCAVGAITSAIRSSLPFVLDELHDYRGNDCGENERDYYRSNIGGDPFQHDKLLLSGPLCQTDVNRP